MKLRRGACSIPPSIICPVIICAEPTGPEAKLVVETDVVPEVEVIREGFHEPSYDEPVTPPRASSPGLSPHSAQTPRESMDLPPSLGRARVSGTYKTDCAKVLRTDSRRPPCGHLVDAASVLPDLQAKS